MVMKVADLFVSEGYKDAGYGYIIIDGPWRNYTHDISEIVANEKKFPKGIKYLVDYVSIQASVIFLNGSTESINIKHTLFSIEKVHSKGLKFGIYTQLDHNAKLKAYTFAKWELDYIKLDTGTGSSGNFANLLIETGRLMALACSWPYYLRRWAGKVRKKK